MTGSKIEQARNAANFVVAHLNQGDRFNVIDFNHEIAMFRNGHVAFTPQARDEAISYISGFQAGGSTNVSSASDAAIPPFSSTDSLLANIIVFFTDGLPMAGITGTSEILAHVQQLKLANETNPIVFSFWDWPRRRPAVVVPSCDRQQRPWGAGRYSISWDGTLSDGLEAPAGVYVYTVAVNDTVLTGKAVRIR